MSADLATLRRTAMAVLAPPEKSALAAFIQSNVVLPSDVSATPGPMKLFSYQRGICDACDDPAITRLSFIKPVRIGASALIVAIIAAFTKSDPCPILCVQPTLDDSRDFCLSTIDPTFAASPNLRGLMQLDKRKRTTITSRRFPGGWFQCVPAQPRALSRKTVRVLLLDEVDRYLPSPEGDLIRVAEKRTTSFPNRLIFQASTPTDAETSNILKAYNESDQRVFELQCPHAECSTWFEPTWQHVKWNKTDDGEHLPDTAYMACLKCGGVIEETQKPALVEAGRWRATAPHVKGHAGFRCSALISTLHNARWSELVREFLAAKDDATLLRVWTNTLMGEAFHDRSGEFLDDHALQSRAEPFGLKQMPEDVRLLTCGIDVQKYGLEAVTMGHSATQVFVLAYETLHGDVTGEQVWKDLDSFLRQRFPHPLGGSIGYDACAIDSGNWTDIVYKFTDPRRPRGVYSVKGRDGAGVIELSNKAGRYIVGDNATKSRLFDLMAAPGRVRFSHDLPLRFYDELTNERRVTFYKAGQPRKRWEIIKGADNEALDATRYAWAIRQILRIDLQRRENELRNIATAPVMPARIPSKWMTGGRG